MNSAIWSVAVAFSVYCLWPAAASAGAKSLAAREAADYVLRKFGKEAVAESAEKLTARIESLALKYGDEAVDVVRKGGPRTLRAIERSGKFGSEATRLLSRQGDKALWIVENPQRLKLFVRYGDDAAAAMLKHKGVAEPLISSFHKPAAHALGAVDGQNARRLAMMAESGELARLGRTDALLATVSRFGNRGMDFIWKNKKALAVGAALTAFLADPQPFIDGSAQLADQFARPVAEKIGGEIARRADWTWLGITATCAGCAYFALRFMVREKLRRRRLQA
ncbi:MAG TPA: hypothetical protein VHC19_06855 [Pirellulales bacterium]|nr:hypothetical protein [Pirellulales bacterium]